MAANNLTRIQLHQGDALLAIDIQNDFLPGGNMAVPKGDEIIPVMNDYIQKFQAQHLPIYASRDWHPSNHLSFVPQGGPWPQHCIAGSKGAEFHPDLLFPDNVIVTSKGTKKEYEAYSVFSEVEFKTLLKNALIQRLFIGGLATDYCVLHCVNDALKNGYQVFLLLDAIRAVNVKPNDGKQAIQTMSSKGANPITLEALQ